MMAVNNVNRNENKKNFISIILNFYVVLVGVGLPLVIRNKYFDIMAFKYYYFCFCTITMIILLISYSFISKPKQVYYDKSFNDNLITKFEYTDYLILLFFIILIISTISSDYVYESFWGNEGRYTGLFLYTWYIVSYFCIAKLWKFKPLYLDLFIITGILVCILGITDYFRLDLFNFKLGMIEKERDIFVSTIGNINTYTAYIGIIIALSTVLFSLSKKYKKILFYYISMFIGFIAIIMGNSDNAYLSLGALFGFLPIILFKNSKGIKKYMIILATFLSSLEIVGLINSEYQGTVVGINSSVFNLIIGNKWFTVLLIIMWLIVACWYIFDYKTNRNSIEFGTLLQHIWLLLIFIIIIFIIYGVYECTFAGNSARYGSLASYLQFNDDWGTNRGYIWRNAIECYRKFSIWKKLFGYGPETFGILLLKKTAGNPYHQLFDSAHNEYLHLLTTVGLLGVLSYLSFVIEIVRDGISKNKNNIYKIAVAFAIICYSVQASVNLNVPVVTPILWLLFGVISAKNKD